MKLIALETSGRVGSLFAAQLEGGAVAAQFSVDLPPGERSARSIGPGLQGLLVQTDWPVASIDAVAVAAGPGSFTGLRIGVTAAKMLAFAAGCPVAPVNTLHVIASQAGPPGQAGWAVMDAQRGELFTCHVDAGGDFGEVRILSRDAWAAETRPGEWVAGPVLSRMTDQLPEGVTPTDPAGWTPRAETVARLGAAAAGDLVEPAQLTPWYFRLSAAEEKRLESEAARSDG